MLSFRSSHAALVWSWIRNKILTDTIFWKASYRSLSGRGTSFVCLFFFYCFAQKILCHANIQPRVYRKIINTHTRAAVTCWECGRNNLWHWPDPSAPPPCIGFMGRTDGRAENSGREKQKCGRFIIHRGPRACLLDRRTHGRTEGCGGVIQINISAREQNVGNTCSQAPPHVGEDARIISTPLDQRITKTAKNGINLALPLDE